MTSVKMGEGLLSNGGYTATVTQGFTHPSCEEQEHDSLINQKYIEDDEIQVTISPLYSQVNLQNEENHSPEKGL